MWLFPEPKVDLPRPKSEFPQAPAWKRSESSKHFNALCAWASGLAPVFDRFALFFPAPQRTANFVATRHPELYGHCTSGIFGMQIDYDDPFSDEDA